MIKLIDNNSLSVISDSIKDTLLGTKIICQLSVYGTDKKFVDGWYCTENDKITAVFCRFDLSVTLVLVDGNSADEVRCFLNMLEFTSLCCSEDDACKLGFSDYTVKTAYIYSGEPYDITAHNLSDEHYRDYYSVVSENIPDSFEDSTEAYLNFLSDFSYRKNRGMARMKGFTDGGLVISGALTSAETENSAIISAVACRVSSRSNGLGKRTVLSLVSELISENKKVYVIALNKAAEGFYEHIGFRFYKSISFIERK